MSITLKEMDFFAEKHPELGGYVTEINGTYQMCQVDEVLKNPEQGVALEQMYGHVYEEGGCEWCQNRIKMLKEYREDILDRASKKPGGPHIPVPKNL
ncbi:hypothetical protein LCGC14_1007600 [marine sediment metagenome]|uniref:Uncharacterized protein n=1 Tax=marine sediment metagenome TaxID=412755 RepID=A0A0F9NMR8_9ZZZZ